MIQKSGFLGTGWSEWRMLWLLSLALMEISWLTGWFALLLGNPATSNLATVWMSALALYLVAAFTATLLSQRRNRRTDWIIGGLALGTILLFIKLTLFPQIHLWNPTWVPLVLRNLIDGSQGWPTSLTGLFLGCLLWFRGLRLPGRHPDLRSTMRQLQLGLAMLIGLTVAALRMPVALEGLILTFFSAGLLAMAFTRILETARSASGATSPFGRQWLITLSGALVAIGLLTLLTNQILTIELLRALLRPLAYLGIAVITAFAFLFGLLAEFILLPLLLRLFRHFSIDPTNFQLPEALDPAETEQKVRTLMLNPALLDALRTLGIFLAALLGLWLVVHSFRRWRLEQDLTGGGIRDQVTDSGDLAEELKDYLQDQWERLRRVAALRRLWRQRGTASIRTIYASFLALMAAAGYPRRAGQTPYEFEPVAKDLLPSHEAGIQAITEAYVRARYGEQEISEATVRQLRAIWRRLEADGEHLIREQTKLSTASHPE